MRGDLGYDAETLRTLTFPELPPERWHAMEGDIVGGVLRPGCSEVYEKECRRRDGSVLPVELRAVLLRDQAVCSGATDDGAAIRITLERLGDRAQLSIRDNAGGIPAEILDKVFDPYFTTKPKGTGIGLYICLGIVEQHLDGGIDPRNTGEGAEFTLYLPVAPAPAAA